MADLKPPEFLPPAVPTTAPAPKRRRIPRRVYDALDLIDAGKTITDAAKKIGWARETLSRRLSRPEVIEAQKIRTAKKIALGMGRAGTVMLECLESGSAKVRMDTATRLLAIGGISAVNSPQVSVNIELKAGYVIDLSEREPPAKLVGGVATIDAKPVE
jgi:hypothetical protein